MAPTTFDELSRSLVGQRRRDPFMDPDVGSLVVVPSLSFPVGELRKITGVQFYEERLLFVLLLLARPGLRVVYVTSSPVEPAIVDYYLSFLPEPERARERLTMVSLGDGSVRALSEKLLGRPELLARIRAAVGDPAGGHLITFNTTPYERRLAEALEMPLFGPDPDLAHLGSKTGGRLLARSVDVPVLDGCEDLRSLEAVASAVDDLRARGADAAVVKLNHGFSGQGNAIVELNGPGGGRRGADGIRQAPTAFGSGEESWASYAGKIAEYGAVVEWLLRGEAMVSPSVQLSVATDGTWQVLSTHDQILGGEGGQVYLGCRFPAQDAYRLLIQEYAGRVAAKLAERGVIGAFGLDFFVLLGGEPRAYMCEINLRLTGTTHPFWMARLATGGTYDPATGQLIAGGRTKCYTATDNLKAPRLVSATPTQVIEALTRRGLAFDPATNTGATLHLLGALREHGKMGATCIAETPQDADRLYEEVAAVLTRDGPW